MAPGLDFLLRATPMAITEVIISLEELFIFFLITMLDMLLAS